MRTCRPMAVGVTALVALGTAASTMSGVLAAESVPVSASAINGSRQFFVEDLTGADLTALDLGYTGQGQPFQTRVKDDNFATPKKGFTASAELTNLYKKNPDNTLDYASKVTSDKLTVSYANAKPDVSAVSLATLPKVQIAGLLPTCSQLPTLLPAGSTLLGTSSLLGTVTGLVAGLTNLAQPLCSALGGATGTLPVSADAADGVVVTLTEKVLTPDLTKPLTDLPITTTSSEAGAFTNPSFQGVGSGDTAGKSGAAAATSRALLDGSSNSTLNLNNLLSPLLDGVPLFPTVPGAPGALTTVSAVVASLQASVDPAVAQVGNALAGLSAADQTGVLSGLTSAVAGTPVATLLNTVLQRGSGNYRSFPMLKADLTGQPSGNYSGTMTVTFVQKP